MKCYEGQERSPDLLQEDEKKKSVGGVAPTSQPDRDEREKVFEKWFIPGQPTWFALEGQDSLDPRLFIVAKTSISIHKSDVISHFSLLRRREEAAQTDGLMILIWR